MNPALYPMTIDEFARAVSTSARNVRSYHERGLLQPPHIVDRTGHYDERHVDRMRTIQRLQNDGFSLSGIEVLFATWKTGRTLEDLVGAGANPPTVGRDASGLDRVFPPTQFRAPGPRPEHVRRERCIDQLTRDAQRHVLLNAPAGSGKTILASQLSAEAQRAAAWVSLEPSESDPARFWTALLLAVNRVAGGCDALLAAAAGGVNVDRLLLDVADLFAARERGLLVVLDDFQAVAGVDIPRQVGWLLARVPANICRFVVCSRSRPSFEVARLVIEGKLSELGATDIGLDAAETRVLLVDRLGLVLDDADVQAIAESTDGWASGIYLAGLSLIAGTPTQTLLDALPSGDQLTQRYFADEILRPFDDEDKQFLLEISGLGRFTPELCDVVRERADSGDRLERLQQASLFVIALDESGEWRRLHHAVAAALRARSRARDEAGHRARLRSAGDWHVKHGRLAEAIDCYIDGAAFDAAARTVGAAYADCLHVSHRGIAIRRWLDRLPPDVVEESPTLQLAAAGVAGLRGEHRTMRVCLARIAELPSISDTHGHDGFGITPDAIRGMFHFGDLDSGLEAARTAHADCPPADPRYPIVTASFALLSYWVDGPHVELHEVLQTAIEHAAAPSQPIALAGSMALQALMLAEQLCPVEAGVLVACAARTRTAMGLDHMPQAANTWASIARARLLLGDVEAAAADALAGYELVSDLTPETDSTGAVVPALLTLGHAERRLGRCDTAERHLEQARVWLAARPHSGRLPEWLAAAEAES